MSQRSGFAVISIFLLISIALVVFLLPGISGCGQSSAPSGELNLDAAQAPYQAEILRGGYQISPDKPITENFLMCDIDGDGVKECVEGLYQKIIGYDSQDSRIKPRWEIHLPDELALDDESTSLGGAADLNGDGTEEIFFTARAVDKSGWNYLVLDPVREEIILNVPLPIGEDRRRPAYWDGHYSTEGFLVDADGEGNPGVVLARIVKYDATYRGICVVEPFTGEIIWDYECGAQLAGEQTRVVDVDGDGKKEILFPTSSPNNWGGKKINGTSDQESYLIALSNRGEELMRVVLGDERFSANLQVADLDGDGIKELITATRNGNSGRTNELAIWDWQSGKIRRMVRTSCNYLGLAVTKGIHGNDSYIFAGTDDGSFHRYLYDGETLERDLVTLNNNRNCGLIGCIDILPPEGEEVIIQVDGGQRLAILDQNLSTLAIFVDEFELWKNNLQIWKVAHDRKTLLLASAKSYWVLAFEKTPFDLAGLLVRVGLPLLGFLVLAGVFYFGMITGRRGSKDNMPKSALAAGPDFDALFRLQQELEDANHSVVGQTKGLERLVWLLEAYVTDVGVSAELEQRIHQVLEDFQVEVRPRLCRLLHLAEQASFEKVTVTTIQKAMGALSEMVNNLAEESLDREAINSARPDLREQWEIVKEGFLQLRTSINGYFTTDPVRLIQGMLLVREGDFQRGRIQTDLVVGGKESDQKSCRMDNGDLHFVMDNLLDNATRAMKEGEGHRLTVKISRAVTEVTIEVTDTGRGISPGLQDAIFSSRFSSRHGGGRGLFRSREILARWGSEILLGESTPGKGTTFIVKLLAATDGNRAKTMEARG